MLYTSFDFTKVFHQYLLYIAMKGTNYYINLILLEKTFVLN